MDEILDESDQVLEVEGRGIMNISEAEEGDNENIEIIHSEVEVEEVEIDETEETEEQIERLKIKRRLKKN